MLRIIHLIILQFILQFSSYCQNECIDKILQEAKLLETNNRQLNTGTGFLLNDDGIIITNKHVASGANIKITVTFKINNKTFTRDAKLISGMMSQDLAIIQTDIRGLGISGNLPYGVDLREPKIGEQISVLGYPMPGIMGQSIKLTNGIVSSVNGMRDDENLFQISAPIQPGNSGSPIIDKNGNIIGIAVSSLRTGQNVNYALKSKLIRTFQLKKLTTKQKPIPSFNLIQNYVCLIAVETDKTYYPELKFKEGNFNLIQNSFFNSIVSDINPCQSISISQMDIMEKEIESGTKYNPQMEAILNNKFANAIYQTYKLNKGWNGYDSYSKLYALNEIGAYDNIIEEVDELSPNAISKDNKWFFYGTSFIPYGFAKVNKLSNAPDSYSIQKLIKDTNEAIEIALDELTNFPTINEDMNKSHLSDYYRILVGLYLNLEEKDNVLKYYQLALKFGPHQIADAQIEAYLK